MAGRKINRIRAKEKAIQALAAGNTWRAAAGYAGISEDTLARWAKEDTAFAAEIDQKQADSEVRLVAIIVRAAAGAAGKPGQWQAAAWLLERHPRTKLDWKRIDELDLRKLSVDQLLALEATCESRVESAGDRVALAGERE